jgi:hypothetical protein
MPSSTISHVPQQSSTGASSSSVSGNKLNLIIGIGLILLCLALVGVVLWWVLSGRKKDGFQSAKGTSGTGYSGHSPDGTMMTGEPQAAEEGGNESWMPTDGFDSTGGVGAPVDGPTGGNEDLAGVVGGPLTDISPADLFPADDDGTAWAQANPGGHPQLMDKILLTPGHHAGTNMVGQTRRNPCLQIRGEPPNPRTEVGPWNKTTIEPDLLRRPLE